MCCKRTDFVINYQSYIAGSHPNEYWFVEKPLRLQILKRYDHRKIRHWIWPKLSIIVIVRSLLDIFFAVVDILSTWIYRRGQNTSAG